MKYDAIEPISNDQAEHLLAKDHRETICETRVRVAMFEPDRCWAQSRYLRFAGHQDSFVRGVSATRRGILEDNFGYMNLLMPFGCCL
jgi:hypothetical protein